MVDVAGFLNVARSGHRVAALNGLMGLGPDSIPALREAFHTEPDPSIRELAVEAAWQSRKAASLELLAEAINDPDPVVWRQAVDGLTALASATSLDVLKAARDRRADEEEFSRWVGQAIEDVTGRINE